MKTPGRPGLIPALLGAGVSALVLLVAGTVLALTGVVSFGAGGQGETAGGASSPDASPAPSSTASEGGGGHESPEEAATAYIESLRAADHDALMGTFATDVLVANYAFDEDLTRMRTYVPTHWMSIPPGSDFNKDLGVTSLKQRASAAISGQYAVIGGRDFDPSISQGIGSADEATRLTQHLQEIFSVDHLSSIDGVEVIADLKSIDPSLGDLAESERNLANMATIRDIYGADDLVNRAVTFSANGREFVLYLEFLKYGDSWWVSPLGSNWGMLNGVPPSDGGLVIA